VGQGLRMKEGRVFALSALERPGLGREGGVCS
jgi:hypothetical protein